MRVGGLEETITVTGETPVVDVTNATRQLVMSDELIQTIPATRAAGALLNATPGIVVGEAGAALSPTMTAFNARSSTINSTSIAGEGRYAINGFPLTAARSGGFASVVYDTVNAEEVAITVGGGLGESDIGGPLMNIVPKSGGNTVSGSAFLSTAGEWSSGNNLTSELQALNPNLRQQPGVITAYDWNVSAGGPIVKDRLWFYGSYRKLDTQTAQDGLVANRYAGDPAHWDWAPDNSINSRLVQDRSMIIGRLTGQFGKNRARFYSEYQARCEGTTLTLEGEGCHKRGEDWIGLGNNQAPTQMSPEATSTAGRGYFDVPFYINQATWTNTASNKLLFDAGFQAFRYQPIFGHPAPDGITGLIPVTQQSNAINPATGIPFAPVANYRYRAVESWGPATGEDRRPQRVGVVRDRRPQHEDRLPVPHAGPAGRRSGQRHAARLPVQRADAERGELLPARDGPPHDHEDERHLRAGHVDDEPAHRAGCAAVGSRVELRAGGRERDVREVVVPEPAADHHRGDEGRGRVQRPHAARGCRV